MPPTIFVAVTADPTYKEPVVIKSVVFGAVWYNNVPVLPPTTSFAYPTVNVEVFTNTGESVPRLTNICPNVPVDTNPVVPVLDWYISCPGPPPAILVAVVTTPVKLPTNNVAVTDPPTNNPPPIPTPPTTLSAPVVVFAVDVVLIKLTMLVNVLIPLTNIPPPTPTPPTTLSAPVVVETAEFVFVIFVGLFVIVDICYNIFFILFSFFVISDYKTFSN